MPKLILSRSKLAKRRKKLAREERTKLTRPVGRPKLPPEERTRVRGIYVPEKLWVRWKSQLGLLQNNWTVARFIHTAVAQYLRTTPEQRGLRPKTWGDPRDRRSIRVTDNNWKAWHADASRTGKSVSQFVIDAVLCYPSMRLPEDR